MPCPFRSQNIVDLSEGINMSIKYVADNAIIRKEVGRTPDFNWCTGMKAWVDLFYSRCLPFEMQSMLAQLCTNAKTYFKPIMFVPIFTAVTLSISDPYLKDFVYNRRNIFIDRYDKPFLNVGDLYIINGSFDNGILLCLEHDGHISPELSAFMLLTDEVYKSKI